MDKLRMPQAKHLAISGLTLSMVMVLVQILSPLIPQRGVSISLIEQVTLFESCVTLILLACSLWPLFSNESRYQPFYAVVLAIVGSVCCDLLAFQSFNFSLFSVLTPDIWESFSKSVPPQILISNTLYVFALILVGNSQTRHSLLPTVSLLGISILGFGGAALFGRVLEVESGYGWGLHPRVSVLSGVTLVGMGVLSASLGWSRFLESELDLDELWQAIFSYSTASTALLMIMAAAFTSMPFYDDIYESEKRRVQDIAGDNATALEQFLLAATAEIKQSRKLLQSVTLEAAVKSTKWLAGASLLERGKTNSQFGKSLNYPVFTRGELSRVTPTFKAVVSETEDFLVGALFVDGEEERVERYALRLDRLLKVLKSGGSNAAGDTNVYLVEEASPPRFFEVKSERLRTVESRVERALRSALAKNGSGSRLFNEHGATARPKILAVSRELFGQFRVVAVVAAEKRLASLNLRLLEYLAAALGLVSVVFFGSYFLAGSIAERGREQYAAFQRGEIALQESLQEKELLLKEIHHRVKNNLQVVSSLLRLQARELDVPEIARKYAETQNRVRSIALLHEMLYRTHSIARIPLKPYVTELCNNLLSFYGVKSTVDLRVDVGDISLNIDQAVPCGLLLNELITNSIKHAFDEEGGTILVSFQLETLDAPVVATDRDESKDVSTIDRSAQDMQQVVMTVLDSGEGYDTSQQSGRRKTLGLRLIEKLVGQLDGSLEISSLDGCKHTITFPFVEQV